MRIIKDSATALLAIAGELINLSLGALVFIDGKVQDNIERGYPRVMDGSVRYDIRAPKMIIYRAHKVPAPIACVDHFHEQLRKRIAELLALLPPEVIYADRYVIASTTELTTVRAEAKDEYSVGTYSGAMRAMATKITDGLRINDIGDFDFDINSKFETEDAVVRHVCSVFYDSDDICALPHNAVVSEFKRPMLRGAANMLNDRLVIFQHGHPLTLELAMKPLIERSKLVRIDPTCIVRADWQDIEPTWNADGADGRCSVCKTWLWEDIYVLVRYADNDFARRPLRIAGTPVCALCAHLDNDGHWIGRCADVLVRTKYPRSCDEMISLMPFNEEKGEVLRELAECGSVPRPGGGSLIGKKFAHMDATTYLFTSACADPLLAGRKIINSRARD